jgi:hypothetical protein
MMKGSQRDADNPHRNCMPQAFHRERFSISPPTSAVVVHFDKYGDEFV